MEFVGRIHKIMETQQVSATFQKRDIVIESSETNGDKTYTELITFQFVQDKVDLLDNYQVGQEVQIVFNLKGRKWVSPQNEEKFFNTLQAFVISSVKGEGQPLPPTAGNIPNSAPEPPVMPTMPTEEDDEIPF